MVGRFQIRMLGLSLLAWAGFLTSVQAQDPDFEVRLIAAGFNRPLYATTPPHETDRLFVLEQRGRIRIVDLASAAVLAEPFLTINVSGSGGERGLLGLAFHPEYATNGLFFVNYTRPGDGATVIARYRVSQDPNRAEPDSAQTLLVIPQPFENHNGGWLGFGPDGFLYASLGDGGSGGDPGNRAQNKNNLLGSLLRLDIDVDDPPFYRAPPSNPFVGQDGDDLIWAYGLRNAWRCSFDRLTGDLFIGDVGQNRMEEINFQAASSAGGENYGWRVMEGEDCFTDTAQCFDPSFTAPIYVYGHGNGPDDGMSVTGGYVYRGPIPSLQGAYLFADFVSKQFWSFHYDGITLSDFQRRTASFAPDNGFYTGIASFGEDGAGNLYIVDLGGFVFKLEALVPPVSVTISGPASASVGRFLQFKAIADQAVESYLWDLGDGVELASTEGALTYAYGEPGERQVSVTVNGAGGGTATAALSIVVTPLDVDEPLSELSAQALASNRALLSWRGGNDADADLTGFAVHVDDELIGTTFETVFEVRDLPPGERSFSVEPIFAKKVAGPGLEIKWTAPAPESAEGLYHLRFPHVAQNQQWWTGLVIVNPNETPVDIAFKVIDRQRRVLAESGSLTRLEPGEKSIGLALDYVSSSALGEAAWFDLTTDQPLVGFELFGQGFAHMAGMEVDGRSQNHGVLPIGDASDKQYVGLSLINPSDGQGAELRLRGHNAAGLAVAENGWFLDPLGKLALVAQDLFGEAWRSDIATITWSSDLPLTGFEIWGDLDWTRQSGMKYAGSGGVSGVLPHVEPGSRIVVQNQAATVNRVALTAFDLDGNRGQALLVEMAPGERRVLDHEAFGAEHVGSVTIVASATVNALCELYRIRSNGDVLAEAVPAQFTAGRRFVYPHIARTDQWTTELILVNVSDEDQAVSLVAYSENGAALGEAQATIPARGRLQKNIQALFGENSGAAYIRAAGEAPVFVAHLIYFTNQGFGRVMGGTVVRGL